MFNTAFYKWKDQTKNNQSDIYNRAESYYLPIGLDKHISAVFNTVQTPIALNEKYHLKKNVPFKSTFIVKGENKAVMYDGTVTVPFLNQIYNINSNLGSNKLNQSVFETGIEYFSPNDLSTFQQLYKLTNQAAVVPNGFSSDQCSATGTIDCFEGNLDIQYIMVTIRSIDT